MGKRSWSTRPTWLIAACLLASTASGNEPTKEEQAETPEKSSCSVLRDLNCVPDVKPWVVDRPFGIPPRTLTGVEIAVAPTVGGAGDLSA